MNSQELDRRIEITGDGNIIGDDSLSLVIKQYSRSEREELLDYLAQAVADYERDMYRKLRQQASPDQPYKSLYEFEISDRDIFFGREVATQELLNRVADHRLTVLHARSGAGKTSLLKAGLSPRLIAEGRLPVYARTRPYEDPTEAVKKAIAPPKRGPWPQPIVSLTLFEFLSLACACLSRDTKEFVIILDQFEQFLVSLSDPDLRAPFVQSLGDCYDQQALDARFVISLRRENMWDLDELEEHIPHVLQNRYALPVMSEAEVVEAITGPLSYVHGEVSFEPQLLDAMLEDLGREDVELTHLQLICYRLFETLPAGSEEITLETYQALGEAEGILSQYLDDILIRLPAEKRSTARAALKELVGSEATNRILDIEALQKRMTPGQDLLDDVLERLVDARLLRRDDESGVPEYELAHAYLASEVIEWVGQDEMENKRAQELLQRELASWRLHKTPIDEERLDVLRDHVRHLDLDDDETSALLLYSALDQGHDVRFWWGQIKKKEDAIRQIPFERMVEHLAENLPVCKRLARQLKSGFDEVLQQPLLSAFWSAFRSADGRGRRDVARALWAFASWLSPQEIVTLSGVLWPLWLAQALPFALGLVLLVLIIPQAWSRLVRVHAVPGRWMPIAGGDFVMGIDREEAEYARSLCLEGKARDKDDCPDSENLLRWSGRLTGARLPDFSIMENEVTNAQYRQCLNDGSCHVPEEWDYKQDDANKPATGLNWSEAMTYCRWLGGRLPTEGEWEKAARGRNGNYFPWDNDWEDSRANLEHYGEGSVQSVKEYAGSDVSPYNIKNMAGNVREWTASVGLPYPEGKSFTNVVLTLEEADENRPVVLRGGHWENERSVGMASRRGLDSIHSRRTTTGFRCVCPADARCESPWTWWWIWFGDY
jgi:formylglycine-generating enzyme required for sulfatase activity